MNRRQNKFDVVIIGNYTKDTIVSETGTRVVDGGGFNYGAHVAAMMGLHTAAVTRLSKEDAHVVQSLISIGITVFPVYTENSTLMRLEYPTSNVDDRILTVTKTAGSFHPDQVKDLVAALFIINSSVRGELDMDVLEVLHKKNAKLAADSQGFVRIIGKDHKLIYDEWPAKTRVLPFIDILKTDAVEAKAMTGESDIEKAAQQLSEWGAKEIVLTHRNGLLVLAKGQFHRTKFLPRKMIGRSGRGDTCLAAYACKRLSASPEEATIWAAAVTSLKMEEEGPIKKRVEDAYMLIEKKYRPAV